MTGIELYTITAADVLVVFFCMALLMVAAMAATLWAARQPAPREDQQRPEPALDVVDAAMVRSRRRRHHIPAHTQVAYQRGQAQVYEGPTVDLTEARRAVRR